jgi:putative nucleotidyltransferase with HDIG domain
MKTADSYLPELPSLTSGQVYLVGGSVRDLLLQLSDIRDIDILIPSGSEFVARAFADRIGGSFFFLDEERKISRVVRQGLPGLLQFDFTDFIGPDLASDLGRRDFTMNAMALDLRRFLQTRTTEGVVDPFNGREDIRNRIVRATSTAVLDEDPLRLLRACRFAATLGFEIDAGTADSIRERSALVTRPAPERIRDELFRILSCPANGRNLDLMDSLGLLSPILPELDRLKGFSPGRYHAFDVRTHSLKAAGYVDAVLGDLSRIAPDHAGRILDHLSEELEQHVNRKSLLRLSCLLHDIAKPETLTRDNDGHIHFYGHDSLGAAMAKEACSRFRLSRASEAVVTKTIKQHMRLFNLSAPGGPSKNALYRYCRDLGDALPESLILSQADARATVELMPAGQFTDTEKPMLAVLEYYYGKFLKTEAKPLVTGQDLIDHGLKPGPRFRNILDEIKERQATGILNDREAALRYLDGIDDAFGNNKTLL